MSSKDKKKGESRKTLRKLMKFIAGYKWLLVISLLLAAASSYIAALCSGAFR